MMAVTQEKTMFSELNHFELELQFEMKIQQLDSLAVSITGEGFEVFQRWADTIQHNLISLISTLALEVKQLKNEVDRREYDKSNQSGGES
jgi:hypothetical protein